MEYIMNKPNTELQVQAATTAAKGNQNYYERYNIDPDKYLIFTMRAFENMRPSALVEGKSPDVAAYEKFIEKLSTLPHVVKAKDINAEDAGNAHIKYIFGVKLIDMLHDNVVVKEVEKAGIPFGFMNIKYLHPRGLNTDVSPTV